MIDIPLGKALVPVECKVLGCSVTCFFFDFKPIIDEDYNSIECMDVFLCSPGARKDNKNVIFKLIDIHQVVYTSCPRCGKDLTSDPDELLRKWGPLVDYNEPDYD